MTPERRRKIEELCQAALERDVTLRAAYLHEACASDDALRQEVESLLAQDSEAGSFLEASPLQNIAPQGERGTVPLGRDDSESPVQSPFDFAQDKLVGRQLGSYLVRAKIGEGGMGEVYRAFDTKLRRDVALKVLPRLFARNPESLARFRREAQLLASLNHKNIAAIYGFEELPEANFLVLELVEGETFQERIKRQGLLPIKDALTLAGQVAEGLEAAHRKGITHRDIKPANIKVTPEGEVKVLDFGLAKALAGDRAQGNLAELPTMEPGPTKDGQILGTPAYMSPEQVRGQEVDKRTDIWAFGCVLYELLTGQRVFQSPDRKGGGTVADIISAILNTEPDWSALPAETPATIRTLLRRCLQKDASRRLHDIADARIEIEEALIAPATGEPNTAALIATRPGWRRAAAWAAAVFASALIAGLAVWTLKPTPPPPVTPPVSQFALTLAANERLPANLNWPVVALSPDGTQLAYAASRGGTQQIYLRAMDSLEAKPLAGTEGGSYPFFSPDGQWLGFLAGGQLKKVSISGGAALTLVPATNTNLRGVNWGDNDMIVFAPTAGGPLSQVPAAGGTPQPLTKVEAGESTHRWPQLLPGGKAVLFAAGSTGSGDNAQIVVQNLETGERKALVQGGTYPRYAPTGSLTVLPSVALRAERTGHLVYYRGGTGTLMAVPFDLERLEVTGSPLPIVEGVMATTANAWGAHFSISDRGSLVYLPGGRGGREVTLVMVDRKGAEQPLAAPPHLYNIPRLSPDGRLVAVATLTPTEIWVYDIARGTLSRLTFQGGEFPLWSPDGKRIAFRSARAGKPPNLFWIPADGSGAEERLTTSDQQQTTQSWSPDGQVLAFTDIGPTTGQDIWVLPLEGDRKPRPFLQTTFSESGARFSPDGRWLAYLSDESGRNEIYVQPFPGPGGKWQISTEGGTQPLWARNGEIFYRIGNQLMVVETKMQPGSQPIFSAGTPRLLFERPYVASGTAASNYDVTADGQRFLMVKPVAQEGAAANQFNVVLNWFEELKRRVPTGQ